MKYLHVFHLNTEFLYVLFYLKTNIEVVSKTRKTYDNKKELVLNGALDCLYIFLLYFRTIFAFCLGQDVIRYPWCTTH